MSKSASDGGGLSRRTFTKATALAGAGLIPALAAQSTLAAGAMTPTVGFESAVALAELIRSKAVSSVELTRYFIDRIERYDEALNAIPVRNFEAALAAAEAADAALGRGEILGPLHGLPMTIKESYDIAGLPTTWGNPDWKDNIAARDSASVARLKQAGAHFMGKTNVPFMLGDFQSFNDIYGTTNNPWDLERGSRRLIRRQRRCARRGPDRVGCRLGHRRFDSQSGPLLRRLRS